MHRKAIVLAGGAVGLLVWFAGAGGAVANFAEPYNELSDCLANKTGEVNPGDNQNLTYFKSSLTPHVAAAFNAHFTYVNRLTSTVGVSAQPVPSPTPLTDAVIYDQAYKGFCGEDWTRDGVVGTFGLASCLRHNSVGECEKNEVRMTTVIGGVTSTSTERQMIACHEIGHAFGLTHRVTSPAQGCMLGSPPLASPTYSDHDKEHLENDLS